MIAIASFLLVLICSEALLNCHLTMSLSEEVDTLTSKNAC